MTGAKKNAAGQNFSLWESIKESVGGSQPDLTEGSIRRAILLLAVPMILEMSMESIFAVVDVFFVSKLGAEAVATVGLTESLLTLIYALSMGLGIGATAVIARRIGEKDSERAAQAAVQAVLLGLAASLPIAWVGLFKAKELLILIGGSPWVIDHGFRYAQVMLVGNGAITLLFIINAIFRGAGDAAISMRTLWLANSINIILGPCLIFGLGPFPKLGVTGAAVGTTIGRSIGVVYQLYRLTRGDGRIAVRPDHLIWDGKTLWAMLKLSGSAVLQMLVGMSSWIGLVKIISAFGSAAIAGYTIAFRLVMFALLPSWGMANAAATLVGQSLGAGKPDRAEQSVWIAGFCNLIFLGVVGTFFFIFAPQLMRAFTSDQAVVGHGIHCLRIVCSGFAFYAYGMVLTQAFNGAGDTTTPTLINLFCFWILELPLAYFLSGWMGWGATGAFVSIAIAFSMVAMVSALLFRRGQWRASVV